MKFVNQGDKYQKSSRRQGDTSRLMLFPANQFLSFKLAGTNGSSDGTIRITPSMIAAGGDAKVEMTDSSTAILRLRGSEVVESGETRSGSSNESKVKSIIGIILESSGSSLVTTQTQSRLLTIQISQIRMSKTKTDVNR